MRKMRAEILLTIGVGLFVSNIFDFRYSNYQGGHYYFDDTTLALLAVGAMCIVFAVMVIKRRDG